MLAPFELHKGIAAVCPIDGVSVGDPADKKTWRIDFSPNATPAQQAAARALLSAWVYADVADTDRIAQLQADVAALNAKVGITSSSPIPASPSHPSAPPSS